MENPYDGLTGRNAWFTQKKYTSFTTPGRERECHMCDNKMHTILGTMDHYVMEEYQACTGCGFYYEYIHGHGITIYVWPNGKSEQFPYSCNKEASQDQKDRMAFVDKSIKKAYSELSKGRF